MITSDVGVIIATLGDIQRLTKLRDFYCHNFKRIHLYIVFKNSNLAEQFFYQLFKECDIELTIIRQIEGRYVTALNMAYHEVREPIVVLNDDDVQLPFQAFSSAKEHLRGEVGCITGRDKRGKLYPLLQSSAMLLNWLLNGELLDSSYIVSISRAGLLATTPTRLLKARLPQISYRTQKPLGAALAFRKECVKDLSIPDITLRGLGNETILSVHCLTKKHLHTIYTPKYSVDQEERVESLSRTRNALQKTFEFYMLPLLLHYAGINIDPNALRKIETGLSRINISSYISIARKALQLSLHYIEHETRLSLLEEKLVSLEREIT